MAGRGFAVLLLVFDVLFGVCLELFEGLRTENVLDATGILRSDLVIDTEGGQKCRQHGVTLVNGLCDLESPASNMKKATARLMLGLEKPV